MREINKTDIFLLLTDKNPDKSFGIIIVKRLYISIYLYICIYERDIKQLQFKINTAVERKSLVAFIQKRFGAKRLRLRQFIENNQKRNK